MVSPNEVTFKRRTAEKEQKEQKDVSFHQFTSTKPTTRCSLLQNLKQIEFVNYQPTASKKQSHKTWKFHSHKKHNQVTTQGNVLGSVSPIDYTSQVFLLNQKTLENWTEQKLSPLSNTSCSTPTSNTEILYLEEENFCVASEDDYQKTNEELKCSSLDELKIEDETIYFQEDGLQLRELKRR